MGVVYAAYDPELDRRVALKLVKPGRYRGDSVYAQTLVRREARIQARLSHPHIVTVFDVGSVGQQVFIAMEFVDGQDLRCWLRSQPRSTAEVLRVLLQAGEGLVAAHAAGLVHCDFKPDNVLVDAANSARVVLRDTVQGVHAADADTVGMEVSCLSVGLASAHLSRYRLPMRTRRPPSRQPRSDRPLRLLLLGGSALQALAAFGCGGGDSSPQDSSAAAGTKCSDVQSALGCNYNAKVGGRCWTGGTINNGVMGTCAGPYVQEKPNAASAPVNNALCSCKTP